MLCTDSLTATLDAVNEALFLGRKIPRSDRIAVSTWLAERCGQPGSYEGMPAPTAQDFANPGRVFTGERLTSRAGTACKLGNEACRALIILNAGGKPVQAALQQAEDRMARRLNPLDGPRGGHYCCGSCTIALWRHLVVGGLDHQEARLATGLQYLREVRADRGHWRSFPSWYTIWALTEIDLPAAREELQYAAPVLERAVKKAAGEELYAVRRQQIARRALGLV